MITAASILEEIKQATDVRNNLLVLKEKICSDLHVAYDNGVFKVSAELLAFLATWPDSEIVVVDSYDSPHVVDRLEFLGICQQHYQKVMNRWHQQHAAIKLQRKI